MVSPWRQFMKTKLFVAGMAAIVLAVFTGCGNVDGTYVVIRNSSSYTITKHYIISWSDLLNDSSQVDGNSEQAIGPGESYTEKEIEKEFSGPISLDIYIQDGDDEKQIYPRPEATLVRGTTLTFEFTGEKDSYGNFVDKSFKIY
jgi:hypothetical protein